MEVPMHQAVGVETAVTPSSGLVVQIGLHGLPRSSVMVG